MQAWQSIDAHSFRTDGDLIFWRIVGVLEGEHLDGLLTSVDAVLSRYHYSVLLADCAQAHNLKADARRRYAEWLKHNPYPKRASIFHSASGELRTFLLLAQRGGQLLSGQRSAIEIVDDEATALERAYKLRAEWSMQPPDGTGG